MHNFRTLQTIVSASRVGPDGTVCISGRDLIGSPGTWVVITSDGTQTTWLDEDFRKHFEPADLAAEAYIILVDLTFSS